MDDILPLLKIKNPFVGVARRAELIDKTIVTKSEFRKLIQSIDPEKGFKTYPSGERKNFYRPWLVSAYKLALETGLRREEFMSIKFSDIITDKKGNPLLIKIENYKVSRSRGVSGTKNATIKHIPITKGLKDLLDELGYEDKKGSNFNIFYGMSRRKFRFSLMYQQYQGFFQIN